MITVDLSRVNKYLKKRIGTGSVIVLREKHDDSYWDASTPEKFLGACLEILKSRFKSGYYYYEPEEYEEEKPELTSEQIEALPEGKIKETAKRQQVYYEASKRYYEQALEEWQRINRAVDENNPLAAWQILMDRSDGEYEGFSLESLRVTTIDVEVVNG